MSESTNSQGTPAAKKAKKRDWMKHLLLVAILGLELFPFYMMAQISVKDNATFIANPWLPPSEVFPSGEVADEGKLAEWHWSNYAFAFKLIGPYIANTVLVAVMSAVGTLALAILGAYFFGRYKVPFSGLLWAAFMFLLLMPGIANLIPLFEQLKNFNLLNSLGALIVVHIAGGQAFNMFVLRNFVEEIPKELFEAAEVDGAGHLKQIWHVVLPMSGSIVGSLAIFTIIGSWNEYVLPLVVLRDSELFTLGVGLIYLDGEYVKEWGEIMASFMVASLPLIIVFIFCMRLFIRGITAGAVKG